MATRYWVGGTGLWTASSTTNWSATSGGTGGASAPTSADDVIFNASSGTGTATSSGGVCASITCTSSSVSVGGAFTVYGSASFSAAGTGTFTSAQITFAPAGAATLTTNGRQLQSVTFTSGTVTLADALTLSGGGITQSGGSLNTNNVAVSAAGYTASGANASTLTLGTTTLTITSTASFTNGNPNLSVSAASSTINFSGSSFTGYAAMWGTVNFTSIGSITIASLRCVNLTFPDLTGGAPAITTLGSSTSATGVTIEVTGTLTAVGTTAVRRRQFIAASIGYGSNCTISAGAVNLANCDFYRITATGAATWTGTNLGDAGFNSGITFAAPKTVYWASAGSATWSAAQWALTSGGTGSSANYPLPQDTAIIDDTKPSAGSTITYGSLILPTISFASRTLAVTVTSATTNPWQCGSRTYSSAVTVTATTQRHYFIGNCAINFGGASATFANAFMVCGGSTLTSNVPVTFTGGGQDIYGTFNMAANISCTSTTGFALYTGGAINLNSYTVTTTRFIATGGAFNFGATGKIVLNPTAATTAFQMSGTDHTVTGSGDVYLTTTLTNAITVNGNFNPTSGSNCCNLYVNAGSYNLTLNSGGFRKIDLTGYTSPTGLTLGGVRMFGELKLPSGITTVSNSTVNYFGAGSSLTSNGSTIQSPLTVDGVGGTFTLNDNLLSASSLSIIGGTLDANDKNVTVGSFVSSGSVSRTLLMKSGNWTLRGTSTVWNIGGTNFTLNSGTSTLTLSNSVATARNMIIGNGYTLNRLLIANETVSSTTTINGIGTFNELGTTPASGSFQLLFTGGQTYTIGNWTLNGNTTATKITIGSTNTTQANLVYSGTGTVTASNLIISYLNASPSMTWLALDSTNSGNNTGWYFGAFPAVSTNNLLFGSNF